MDNGEIVELYRKYRPKLLKDIVGQPEAVKSLTDMLKRKQVPHCILFTGPSGTGKTTLARILKEKLECGDQDFQEINCAAVDGAMEMVRGIQQTIGLAPMSGRCRIWLLDEVQSLSRAGFAQQALLKLLEDTPSHAYLMLCTTDPTKLIKTIHTRCTEIKLGLIPDRMIAGLVNWVSAKEGKQLTKEEEDRIAEVAEGSARKALVILHQVIGLETKEERLEAIQKSDSRRQGIELARLLLKPGAKWSDVAVILKDLEEEPETIRRLILGYMSSVLLSGGNLAARAFEIIQLFRDHYYDVGKPGLVSSCWDACHQK